MYLERKWYTLKLKKKEPELDSALLTNFILSPILGIRDLRTSKRISFISGTQGTSELKRVVDNRKGSVGFSLFPVTIFDIVQIADAGETMPPKSTWVEPKMSNGLVIYSLSELPASKK